MQLGFVCPKSHIHGVKDIWVKNEVLPKNINAALAVSANIICVYVNI